MAAVVTEELAHRAARVRSEELHSRGIRSRGVDDDRVVHRTEFLKLLTNLSYGRCLLADRDVNADDVLALLVDDRVDRDSRLTGLAVADDQLPLAPADGNHRVDSLETCLKRLLHRLTVNNTGSDTLDGEEG